MQHKQELTSKTYSLNSRLKLFEAVITPTVLYGAGAWTLNKQAESILLRTQRRMLRMILGAGRRKFFNSHVTTGKEEAESEQDVESDVESIVPRFA